MKYIQRWSSLPVHDDILVSCPFQVGYPTGSSCKSSNANSIYAYGFNYTGKILDIKHLLYISMLVRNKALHINLVKLERCAAENKLTYQSRKTAVNRVLHQYTNLISLSQIRKFVCARWHKKTANARSIPLLYYKTNIK